MFISVGANAKPLEDSDSEMYALLFSWKELPSPIHYCRCHYLLIQYWSYDYGLNPKSHNRKETVDCCCPWCMPNTANGIQLGYHKPICTFLLTPLSDRKFDCVIQSRHFRENRALKQPEKLSPSPMICPDVKRLIRTLCPGVSRSVFKTERKGKRNLQNTPLKNDCRLVPFLCDISLV